MRTQETSNHHRGLPAATLILRRLAVLAVCVSVSLAAAPRTVVDRRCQEPGVKPGTQKPPEAKPPNDILDAEREKLRMKDVEGWKKFQVKSLAEVIDVKKTTQPIELPASITDAEKAKMVELLQRAKDGGGGARTGRALREFEKLGYPALLFLINELREIDYKDVDSSMFGMQLNMTLTNITLGVNTGYVAIDVGEPMDPRKAQWNAMTVQQWLAGAKAQWPTREKFDAYIAARKQKKEAELEGEKKPPEEKKKG